MHTEYEVRILEIDVDDVKKRLESIGAKLLWDRIQKRYVYDFNPKLNNKWIRLRTNGDKCTLTIKELVSSKIDGTKELEIVVDDFNKTNLILNELGYKAKGYQENRRIRYEYNGVEIDIDYWPLIPAYLEIEGSSEKEVYEVVRSLGFKKKDTTALDCVNIYLNYGFKIDQIYELKLEEEKK